MAWFILIFSGAFEAVWAAALDKSAGFTRLWPSLIFLVACAISMGGLAWAMRSIPVGTAYAVWTGIGAVGAAAVGILVYGEPATAVRLVCILLIVSGIVGLKLFSH